MQARSGAHGHFALPGVGFGQWIKVQSGGPVWFVGIEAQLCEGNDCFQALPDFTKPELVAHFSKGACRQELVKAGSFMWAPPGLWLFAYNTSEDVCNVTVLPHCSKALLASVPDRARGAMVAEARLVLVRIREELEFSPFLRMVGLEDMLAQ